MKPVILVKERDGKVHLTVEEIKKMIEDAYDHGYCDGRAIEHNANRLWDRDGSLVYPTTTTAQDILTDTTTIEHTVNYAPGCNFDD